MKQEYKVRTQFIFEGDFIIKCENEEEAREHVERHCGLVLGGDLHSTLSDEDIDWDFNIHPETKILDVKNNSVMGVIGYYSRLKYEVMLIGTNGEIIKELFSAGNCKWDNQQVVPAKLGVNLVQMKQWCMQTAMQIAEEQNVKYLGIEQKEIENEN